MSGALVCVVFAPVLVCWGLWLAFAAVAALPERRRRRAPNAEAAPVIDILIPAHNEELLLPRLLESLQQQTGNFRRGCTLVVADHCDDRTARLAREAGAEVLERLTGPRGKPAALRDGLAALASKATVPDEARAVLILDADCTVSANCLAETAAAMARGCRSTQAAYLLDSGDSQRLHGPAMIAFALKNVIRPRGMARLALPSQLFGTGMCFRADLLKTISFNDHLTEDLAMSHDLLLAGAAPRFLASAVVRSPLPEQKNAMTTQKLRWEAGQIATWNKLPAIYLKLLRRGRLGSAVALIDWSAPPLAMAVMYWFVATVATAAAVLMHVASPLVLIVPALSMACLAAYLVVGGLQVAGVRGVLKLFLGVPRFLFWKLALYARMLAGRGAKSWVRTPRAAVPQAAVPTGIANPATAPARGGIPIAATQTRLLGMPLHAVTEAEALEVLEHRLTRGVGTWVVTPNLDILRRYCKDPNVRSYFHAQEGGADLLLADGMPLVWASRISGRPVPERVPGSGIVWSLSELAARRQWRIFLLGGSPGAADRASAVLQARYPGIQIAGTCCPDFGFENDPVKMGALREQVRAANPQIVYVALGFPKQELVTLQLRTVLPRATFIGVGISLSFMAGEIRRAPRVLQKLGFEWAHRLVQEPRRLARRYLVHDLPFALFHLFPKALAARWMPALETEATPQVAMAGGLRASVRNPADVLEPVEPHPEWLKRRRPGHDDAVEQAAETAAGGRVRRTQDRVPS